jgi:hypothetical protein
MSTCKLHNFKNIILKWAIIFGHIFLIGLPIVYKDLVTSVILSCFSKNTLGLAFVQTFFKMYKWLLWCHHNVNVSSWKHIIDNPINVCPMDKTYTMCEVSSNTNEPKVLKFKSQLQFCRVKFVFLYFNKTCPSWSHSR